MVNLQDGETAPRPGAASGSFSCLRAEAPSSGGANYLRLMHTLANEISLLCTDLAKHPDWLAGNPVALLSLAGVLADQAEARGDALGFHYWRYQQVNLTRLVPSLTPLLTHGTS